MCTQEEAETLGFASPQEAAEHTQLVERRRKEHEAAKEYQRSPECEERKRKAARGHGITPEQIAWVIPPR